MGKKADRVEIDVLFGLLYFRRILGVNLKNSEMAVILFLVL